MDAYVFTESDSLFFIRADHYDLRSSETEVFLDTRNRCFVPELLNKYPSCKIIYIRFNYDFSLLFLLLIFCLESSCILSLFKVCYSHILQFLTYLYLYFPGGLTRFFFESAYLR